MILLKILIPAAQKLQKRGFNENGKCKVSLFRKLIRLAIIFNAEMQNSKARYGIESNLNESEAGCSQKRSPKFDPQKAVYVTHLNFKAMTLKLKTQKQNLNSQKFQHRTYIIVDVHTKKYTMKIVCLDEGNFCCYPYRLIARVTKIKQRIL